RERLRIDALEEAEWGARRASNDSAVPHHAAPAHEGANGPPLYALAVVRRPASAAGDLSVGDRFLTLQVDHHEVGVVAGGDTALAADAEQALRAVARQIDEALDAETSRIDV